MQVNAHLIRRYYPNAEVHIVKGYNHLVYANQQPDAYAGLVPGVFDRIKMYTGENMMNKKDLNQMENTTSAQVYYQWLEKSISASKGCYEMTVIEGELSGMKILWEGEMPVCVYMTDEKTETKKKAAAIITSVMEQSEWTDRRLPSVLEFDFGKVFAEKVGGGQQMIICGAGHVSIALLRMARMVGFHVTVIDDRPAFCNKAREAGADEVICEPFSQALEAIDDRNEPYFVIVTRGHQYDVDCMQPSLENVTAISA